ncbi:MAG: helix-turn-helix domain-containing protein [Oscillospiraceae bacterium]|nr:helix-turn-helix domain-containing protein [Oscillospiraceae bacterium]
MKNPLENQKANEGSKRIIPEKEKIHKPRERKDRPSPIYDIPPFDKTPLVDNIKSQLLQKGWSQMDLAICAGLKLDTVSKCCNPQAIGLPNLDTLHKIAVAFDVKIEFLLCGNQKPYDICNISRDRLKMQIHQIIEEAKKLEQMI